MPSYTQNHTYQDISLVLGETWTIFGTLNKDSSPLPVNESTQIQWRLANTKSLVLSLSLTSDISITDFPTAAYQVIVPVSQQINNKLNPGLYRYELSAILDDGTVSIQAEGACTLNSSLTFQYPN